MTIQVNCPRLLETLSFNPNAFKEYCIRVFSYVKPGSTFLSIKNYQNNWNEFSDFGVCFHADYMNAVKRSRQIVKNYRPKNSHIAKYGLAELKVARKEMLDSFTITLSGMSHPAYTCHGVYEDILGADNKPISGIKLHTNQDIVHINALKFRKKIIKRGQYPFDMSSLLARAKRFIKSITPLCNWVQFKLIPGRFSQLSVQKMIIYGS